LRIYAKAINSLNFHIKCWHFPLTRISKIDGLLFQIEELRIQMQKIALDKDLTDPRVVSVSERLDILINQFYISQETKKVVVEAVDIIRK